MTEKNLLAALAGKSTGEIPFWFMRQAGRYLPEYRALRAKNKDFLSFCYTPEAAAEATLQPITRFGMSAAILFSDILVIPDALGMQVHFKEGVGPRLTPLQSETDLATLSPARLDDHLAPVYRALQLIKPALPSDTALIGFAGAPWTLACYMVEGKASRDFQSVRATALRQPQFFSQLLALLTQAVTQHLLRQIDAGAEALQLFDSWAGVLSEQEFADYVIAPTRAIASAVKAARPGIPIIGFPRLAGSKYLAFAEGANVDAISFDGSVSLDYARAALQPKTILQGNLDSLLLAEDKTAMLAQAKKIIDHYADNAFIFNLGHGILPHTPVEHVQALCDLIKMKPWQKPQSSSLISAGRTA